MTRALTMLLCALLSLCPSGCAKMKPVQKGAIGGAVVGSLVSAAVGGITGGPQGAIQGAAAGLVAGAIVGVTGTLIGCYNCEKQKNAIETASEHSYTPDQGYMIWLEEIRTEPETIEPGQPSKLIIKYALMGPSHNKKLLVVERRELRTKSKLPKEITPKLIERDSGTYFSEQEITFPMNVSKGDYIFRASVETEGVIKTQEYQFNITKIPQTKRYALHFSNHKLH